MKTTIGKWYRMLPVFGRSDTVQLLAKERGIPSSSTVAYDTMAVYRASPDATSKQRLDVWEERVEREATPQEIVVTLAAWKSDEDHAARTIDTSREGT